MCFLINGVMGPEAKSYENKSLSKWPNPRTLFPEGVETPPFAPLSLVLRKESRVGLQTRVNGHSLVGFLKVFVPSHDPNTLQMSNLMKPIGVLICIGADRRSFYNFFLHLFLSFIHLRPTFSALFDRDLDINRN